jgi:hypothetical protein
VVEPVVGPGQSVALVVAVVMIPQIMLAVLVLLDKVTQAQAAAVVVVHGPEVAAGVLVLVEQEEHLAVKAVLAQRIQ